MTKVSQRNHYHPVNGPRTHANCKALTGVFRPGKTARDKAQGSQRFHKNRRIWDSLAKVWVKTH